MPNQRLLLTGRLRGGSRALSSALGLRGCRRTPRSRSAIRYTAFDRAHPTASERAAVPAEFELHPSGGPFSHEDNRCPPIPSPASSAS
jgi:hypothetical protein